LSSNQIPMRKFVFTMLLFAISRMLTAQVTYNTTFTASSQNTMFYSTKLSAAGYKYVIVDYPGKTIKLYNLNNSLYLSISIPYAGAGNSYYIAYLSDKLFDLNNDIEYALISFNATSMKFHIYDETGALMFSRDSANLGMAYIPEPFLNQSGIFHTSAGTKMRLIRSSGSFNTGFELYDLPGSLPCMTCADGTTSATSVVSGGVATQECVYYPNPSSGFLKLKYELPASAKHAYIDITDTKGTKLERFEVSADFDHILMPASYNDGLYFYSLYVDGKLVNTSRVILNR
jgi:hypothetical protein